MESPISTPHELPPPQGKHLNHFPIFLPAPFFRLEDGNNLTSNLFPLITPLTTHKNTSDICSYKPYIEKKMEKKKHTKTVRYVHLLKESGAKKQQHSNQFFKGKTQDN